MAGMLEGTSHSVTSTFAPSSDASIKHARLLLLRSILHRTQGQGEADCSAQDAHSAPAAST